MARNPYDRRNVSRENPDAMMRHGMGFGMLAGDGPHFDQPRALAIEDLDAIAFSARARGHERATQQLEQQHREDLANARREAWDEGHQEGVTEGERSLLARIDALHGQATRELVDDGEHLLEDLDQGRKVTKETLREGLGKTTGLLRALLHSHHDGFAEDLPF